MEPNNVQPQGTTQPPVTGAHVDGQAVTPSNQPSPVNQPQHDANKAADPSQTDANKQREENKMSVLEKRNAELLKAQEEREKEIKERDEAIKKAQEAHSQLTGEVLSVLRGNKSAYESFMSGYKQIYPNTQVLPWEQFAGLQQQQAPQQMQNVQQQQQMAPAPVPKDVQDRVNTAVETIKQKYSELQDPIKLQAVVSVASAIANNEPKAEIEDILDRAAYTIPEIKEKYANAAVVKQANANAKAAGNTTIAPSSNATVSDSVLPPDADKIYQQMLANGQKAAAKAFKEKVLADQ